MSTAELIRQTAKRLFTEYGYAGTSIGMLAEEVGIKKASIYSHIDSKEELYQSILEEIHDFHKEYYSNLLEQNKELGVKERFELILRHSSLLNIEEPHRTDLRFMNRTLLFPPEFLQDGYLEIFNDNEAKFAPIFLELVREGQEQSLIKDVPPEDIVIYFFCTADGLFIQSRYYNEEEYRKKADAVCSLFWEAIKA